MDKNLREDIMDLCVDVTHNDAMWYGREASVEEHERLKETFKKLAFALYVVEMEDAELD